MSTRAVSILTGLVLGLVIIRFGWLFLDDQLKFETDLLPVFALKGNKTLAHEAEARQISALNRRVTLLVAGDTPDDTDAVTDEMAAQIASKISTGLISGKLNDQSEFSGFNDRIAALSTYKDRLLADRSRERLHEGLDNQLASRIQSVMAFPPVNITDPVVDPLGTLEEFILERLPRVQNVEFDGLYYRTRGELSSNLVLLELTNDDLGNEVANRSALAIIDLAQKLESKSTARIYLSGYPLHAAVIKFQTMQEIWWIGLLASLFTFAFFLFITRSFYALLWSSILVAVSLAGGMVFAHSVGGLPHLIGLTMAVTAIGICIDFSFHYWIHVRSGLSGSDAIRSIGSSLDMGCITTVFGLLVVAVASLPILSQTAVFIIGAVVISWAIVRFVFPQFHQTGSVARYSRFSQITIGPKTLRTVLILVALASVTGIASGLYTDDSPARLGQRVSELTADEQIIGIELGISSMRRNYLVSADSSDQLLEQEEKLLEVLGVGQLGQIDAVSRLIPSIKQQSLNQAIFTRARQVQKNHSTLLDDYLNQLGVDNLDWSADGGQSYTLPWVLQQSWAEVERNLIIECGPDLCASVVRASGDSIQLLDQQCALLDSCSSLSILNSQTAVFKRLRETMMWTWMLIIVSVFTVLAWRYQRRALQMIWVPLLACTSGIGAVALAGYPLTVFTVAALFPLVGLSADYSIFLEEAEGRLDKTRLAVFASALTTFASFAILCISSTPAVRFFAIPVAVGIVVAWLTALWVHSTKQAV